MALKVELRQTRDYTTNVLIHTRDWWRDSGVTVY